MLPATIRPGGIWISFSTVIAVTVLPQPDSPTTPRVSPRSMVRSTPSTARTMPSSVSEMRLQPADFEQPLSHALADASAIT